MNHIILDNDLILGQNIAYSKAGLTREVLFALVGSAVLLLINGAMYYYGYYMWSAIIITTFLFFYTIYIIVRNFLLYNSNRAALVIAEEGLVENVHTKQFIEWQQIKSCYVVNRGFFQFLIIDMQNPAQFQAKSSSWKNKLFFYSNISTFQTPLAIQNTFYDADIHDIAQKINQKINL
jgi:hypothetical protein